MKPPFPRSLRFVAILAASILALASVEGASSKRRTTKDPARVFVVRGGGGYFPNLGTVVNEKFEEKGLEVVDFRYHERNAAAKRIAQSFREGELPHGVILVGYSLGGCGVIEISRALEEEEIPVRLLFLIETINPLQTVPGNVVECFNLYHFPAILGAPVRAESKETKLTNFEAYRDGGLGLEYSHFAMPFVEKVHDLIAERLLATIEAKPSRRSSATANSPKRKPSGGAELPAAEAKKEARPGLLTGLFRKGAATGEAETEPAGRSSQSGSGR